MFDRLKRFLKRLFSKPKPKVYAEVKNWPEGWGHHPPPKPTQLPCELAQPKDSLTPQEERDVKVSLKEIHAGKAQVFRSADELIKDLRTQRIADANRTRRTKFAHAEHFKRRQPTTARKLWNPQAQPKTEKEEEENT